MSRTSSPSRRPLAVVVLLVLAILSGFAALSHRELPWSQGAARYARDISVAASATYVTLRSLNAFLSTAQELEVEGSLVFASGSAQPLKVLEPIDDTVERVASVVFWVMLASGVLAITMGPLGGIGFALVALAFAAWAAAVGSGRALFGGVPRQLATYGGFLALGVPLAFLASSLVADRLTDDTWAAHARVVAEITATVDGEVPDEGALRNMMGQIDRYRELATNISSRADELIASLLSLLSVYIFKVLVLPILLIGALLLAARRIGVARGGSR